MPKKDELLNLEISSQDSLRDWLTAHHDQSESIWLVTWKSSHADKYVSREQVLDELLCFGWIDGIRAKVDDDRTKQLISPRQAQHWHKSYKDRAARLIEEGLMAEPGLQSIQDAKTSGLWTFMDDVDALIVPADLRDAVDQTAASSAYFDSLNDSYLRNVLRWLKLAKTEKTRAKRIQTVFESCRDEVRMKNF